MTTWLLYLTCVAIWGSTWIAVTLQLGTVPPAVSVTWRFATAAAILFGISVARRCRLRFGWSQHVALALQGLLMYSAGYLLVYEAESRVVSGLVAVGYAASPLVNMLCARLLFGAPVSGRVTVGGLVGLAGVGLVFAPELGAVTANRQAVLGAALTAAAVIVQAVATVIASRNPARGITVWPALAWSMTYGAAGAAAWAAANGATFAFDPEPRYVASWAYLTVFGSVIAFAAYLTLLERIGPGPAGYIGVMVPVVALALSAAFEGFRWGGATWLGVAAALAGNVVALGRRRKKEGAHPSAPKFPETT